MSRRLRIVAPPPANAGDPSFRLWAQQITDAVNLLPNFSLSSTSNGPNSFVTGDSGTILIDVGSSATTFWFKRHGDNNMSGWSAIGFA